VRGRPGIGRRAHRTGPRLGALAGLFAFVLLALLLWRPAPVFGIDARVLASSMGASGSGTALPEGCHGLPDGRWVCVRHDRGFSSTVTYLVRVDGWGCWSADLFGPRSEGAPTRIWGCIGALAYVFG
jgi:hypothetical protein